jgi:putative MATE family efflux protein
MNYTKMNERRILMDNVKELGTKSVTRLIAQYSIPAVIAMLVNAIYNIVDRIFIGNYAGEAALAGLTVVFPIMMIIFAFVSLIATGGTSLLSIRLGEGDLKGANKIFTSSISIGLIVNLLTLIIVFMNLDSILTMFGANEEVLSYSSSYMRIILSGFIFQMMSFLFMNFVRTEGMPILSMLSMVASAVSNIILDYIFIVRMDMGVSGAALATITGQFIGLAILLSFYIRGRSQLKIEAKYFIPEGKLVKSILSIGFASFISVLGTSVSMTFINRELGAYGGTAAITSMGAINSLYTFFIMPIMGITQGIQPIIGYNHGSKDFDRVRKTLFYSLAVGVVFSTIVFVLLQLYSPTFIALFLGSESATLDIAVNGTRIYIAMLPFLSINLMGIAYFQSIARGRISMILGLLRQFVLLIPLLMILPGMFGLNGVWMSVPIADGLSIVIVGLALWNENRKKDEVDFINQQV